jgi:hypothetical protein
MRLYFALAAALLAGAPTADAATPAEAISLLNAQRAAHGIPAGIVENPEWSAGCAAHMEYLRINGFDGDWHDQIPGAPGYSEAGRAAAGSAVLTSAPWTGAWNPWENAPLHLAQLLAPALSVTGYADGCMYTWPGYQRPEPDELQLYTYPGDGNWIYPSMVVSELPFAPGDFVGVPQGVPSGPHLYVFAFGAGTAWGSLSDVSVTGPDGPVDVRVVDNTTPTVGFYIPPGGIVIPVAPLRADAIYDVTATFTSQDGVRATRSWHFRTGDVRRERAPAPVLAPPATSPAPRLAQPRVTLRLKRAGRGARAAISARAAAVGRRARVSIRRLGCRCATRTLTIKLSKRTRVLKISRRPARVTLTLDAFAGHKPLRLTRTI